MRIGFIGLGVMGAPMARHPTAAGGRSAQMGGFAASQVLEMHGERT